MNSNVGSDNSEALQSVVESVETVEVVSGSDNVLSPSGAESNSKVSVSSQLSVPSSGVSEYLKKKGETFSVNAQLKDNS